MPSLQQISSYYAIPTPQSGVSRWHRALEAVDVVAIVASKPAKIVPANSLGGNRHSRLHIDPRGGARGERGIQGKISREGVECRGIFFLFPLFLLDGYVVRTILECARNGTCFFF